MKIGIIDVDGHNFPNLALMKLSAYHKARGDYLEWCLPFDHYDIIYQAKVFDETYSPDIDWVPSADKVFKGGTGYVRRKQVEGKTWLEYYHNGAWIKEEEYKDAATYLECLPDEVEHTYPDYSLYFPLTKDTAYGYLTRGCPRACGFCIVSAKEGRKSVKVANLSEFWRGQRNIELLDPNLLACREHMELLCQLRDSGGYVNFNQGLDIRLMLEDEAALINSIKVRNIHFAWDDPEDNLVEDFERYKALAKHKPHGRYGTVYVLTNYGSTMEGNLYRIYTLRDMGYDPYVMVYDKTNAPLEIRRLQRWCNNKPIFRSCPDFEGYKAKAQ